VPNAGVDTLAGGNGNDRFHTRDGEADVITCGAGFDVVFADEADVISDKTDTNALGSCEKVVRRDPGKRRKGHGDREER